MPKDKFQHGSDSHFLKRSVNGLTCGAVEIVKSLDRHITSKLNRLQQPPSQHDKGSPPQSQSSFYVVPDINVIKSNSTEQLSHCQEIESINESSPAMTDRSSTKKVTVSKSTPNLDKQDSGSSSTGSSGYKSAIHGHQPNEDFARHMEHYERNLERRTRPSSKRSSAAAASNTAGIKASTILSLDDRDLIIIDNTDIKEAISNQGDVIIVDPPTIPQEKTATSQGERDLKDILGDNWPTAAGDLAPLLNNEKKVTIVKHNSTASSGSTMSKYERNKSMNPISHLMATTKASKETRDFSTSTNEFVNGHHKRSKYFSFSCLI